MGHPLRSELSAEMRDALDEMTTSPRPCMLPIEEARRLKREGIEPGATPDEDGPVAAIDEYRLPGPADGRDVPVRIYTPEGDRPFPVLVWIQGGGFVRGTLDTSESTCRYLTGALDATVVAVDYRLAPEHPFPAALRDCYAAVEWVAANPGPARADPNRLAVGGLSAGGTLSAAVSLLARDRDGPAVSHQLLGMPMLDPELDTDSVAGNATGYGLTRADLEYYWDAYCPSDIHANNPYAVPALASDLSGLPPATVVTAGFDPLRDEGIEFAERLDAAGVPVTHHHFPGLPHHLSKFRSQDLPSAVGAFDEVASTLRGALHGEASDTGDP